MPTRAHNGRQAVAFTLLGTQLDKRGQSWRPSLELARALLCPAGGRLVILHQPPSTHREIASQLAADVGELGHGVETELVELKPKFNPWKFNEVYTRLAEYADRFQFDDSREEYFVSLATGTDVAKVALFLLTERRRFPAKLVQVVPPSSGRSEWVSIINLDEEKYAEIAGRAETERGQQIHPLGGIVCWGKSFTKILERVLEVGQKTRSPLLLTGPTGAGKSFIARSLHATKFSRAKVKQKVPPFVEANCATLRGEVLLSTLFGHEKGAFTGAEKPHVGLVAQADSGMLFLDEIGELPESAQAMLLTALDTGEYRPLGGTETKKSRFQLVAATKDLLADVTSGRFREDLYFRLSTFTFPIPGLAERPEDIEPFLRFTIDDIQKNELYVDVPIYFDPEAERCFIAHAKAAAWPGNLREFRQMVLRAAVSSDPDGRVRKKAVDEVWGLVSPSLPASDEERILGKLIEPGRLAEIDFFDRIQLARVIEVCRRARSQAEAGRRLFDQSRKRKDTKNDSHRLSQYLKRFGLTWNYIKFI